MQSDNWPRLDIARFEREPETVYRSRANEITRIIEGFRMGRFHGDMAELMERRLVLLEERGLDRLAS